MCFNDTDDEDKPPAKVIPKVVYLVIGDFTTTAIPASEKERIKAARDAGRTVAGPYRLTPSRRIPKRR